MKKLLVTAAVALFAAGTAQAGNWASVKLAAAPPASLKAGKPWVATFSVLRHGLASQPVDGVRPTVTITRPGGEARTFRARPAGKPGLYRASVVFPSGGTWAYAIYDGFTMYGHAQTHRLGSVTVHAAAAGGGFPVWELGGSLFGAAVLAAGFLAIRRIRPLPSPAAQR